LTNQINTRDLYHDLNKIAIRICPSLLGKELKLLGESPSTTIELMPRLYF